MSYAEFNRLHRKEFPREILQVKCSNQFLPVRRIFRMERHLSEKMTQEMLFFAASVDIPEYASDDWEVTTEDNLWVPTLNAFVASWSGLSPKRFLIFEFVQSSLAFVDFDFALHSVPNQFQLDLQCRPHIRSPFNNNWKSGSNLIPWFQDLSGNLYRFLFTDLLFVNAWSKSIDGHTITPLDSEPGLESQSH